MRQNMSKKIVAMGIAGLTGFALLSSSLGNNVLVADAKTNETVTTSERQEKVKPVTGSAIDIKDKAKPATGSAIDGKDKVKPENDSDADKKDKVKPENDSDEKDKVKPENDSVADKKDKVKPENDSDEKDRVKSENDLTTDKKDKVKPENDSDEKDKVKPATGSAIDEKDKVGATNSKKVKVKNAKKTAKNKIKISLDGTNTWSNVNVSVKTAAGKTIKAKLLKKTSTYCVIQTNKKLEKKTYVIKVKGVKVKGASKYETITTKVKVN